MQFRSWPMLVAWLAVPLCYYAGARLGVSVAAMPEGISVLWPPNSVLLVAMLLRPAREMPVIAALGVATEIAADWSTFTLAEAVVFGTANALEASLACALLRAWRFDERLSTLADVGKFMVAGPLLSALLAAAGGAAVYAGVHPGDDPYAELLRVWWLGDGLGLMIFTPLLLSLATGGRERGARWTVVDLLVGALGLVIAAAVALATRGRFGGVQVAPALLMPCVVYLAARFELRVVSVAVAIAGLAIAFSAVQGRQPYGALPPHEQVLRVQESIFTLALLALGAAALLGQLRLRQGELREANARLDQLNRELEARVAERTAQLDDSNRQLQTLAMTDALTGIANRRAFFAAAPAAAQAALRYGHPLALVMIDVDRFKGINDRFGHAAGDAVLRHVADTLKTALRAADTLARYGGEEFIVLAPQTDLSQALALAQRMGDAVRDAPLALGGDVIHVTASFGVTVLGEHADSLEQLIQRADAAMYEAKRAGRDRVVALECGAAASTPPEAVSPGA